jgi:large subunit ribosomal protein L22
MAAVAATDRDVFRARARFVRTSARKARLVLDHVRGLGAVEAEAVLRFETRAVARDVAKVLKSAVSNAEANFGHDADELIVVAAYADEGPTLKRIRPRAQGRAYRIRKRTSHITVIVESRPPREGGAKSGSASAARARRAEGSKAATKAPAKKAAPKKAAEAKVDTATAETSDSKGGSE